MTNYKSYKIIGEKKLSGTIATNGAKNSAVALLAASLLNEKTTILHNMPRIEEVFRLIEVAQSIGVEIKWLKDNVLKITPPKKFKLQNININAAAKTRSIILFIGSLISKVNQFVLPLSGGCKLGKRTILPHYMALKEIGVSIKTCDKYYKISRDKNTNHKRTVVMYESGDTATENIIMASASTPGVTTIKFASANYQIQDLCYYLQKLGVKIKGIGNTTLTVYGKKQLSKNIEYFVSEDPIESMLFLSIAATTNSSITIKRCPIDFLELELCKLSNMNFKYKIIKKYKSNNNQTNLVDIKTFKSNLIAPSEKLYGRPFPGLNIDNLPFFVPIATQAKGRTLVHDWVYENRAIYYIELVRLGAKILLADPHRVFIDGPAKLTGAEVVAPPALRPSAIVLVAMLAAKGASILRGVYGIERGYENLVERLQKIGADIKLIQ